jgi:hypothetical protein
MAKQVGFGMLVGTIGDLTFYERNGQYYVKRKPHMKAERVREAPEFARTREINQEFKAAMGHGMGIRRAVGKLVYGLLSEGNSGKMAAKLSACIRSNPVGARGERKLNPGTLSAFLSGFDFNTNSPLTGNFPAVDGSSVKVLLNRVTGKHRVKVSAFDAGMDLLAPGSADRFSFVAGIAAWDGTEDTVMGQYYSGWKGLWKESMRYEVGNTSVPNLTINLAGMANETRTLVVVFGVRYWERVGSEYERVRNGKFDCLRVVKVSGI